MAQKKTAPKTAHVEAPGFDMHPRPTGKRRTFRVQTVVDVVVTMDETVVREVNNDEWRSHHYDLHSAEDIAEHLAFNALLNDVDDPTRLDGFAHFTPAMFDVQIERDAVDFDTTQES